MIVFEYPLNERVRTWLRLENLFDRALFFIGVRDARSHHAALLAMFELVEIMARQELRSELIQELDRQRSALEALRHNPAVDNQRLSGVLAEIANVLAQLHAHSGKLGQHLRDNEWLAGIRSRTGIPGGACGFDLPGYHYWLQLPAEHRIQDLMAWLSPMLVIKVSVEMVLKLLRESGTVGHYVAANGLFQLMIAGRIAHLLRVGLEEGTLCVPEVSANKYAVNLRFVTAEKNQKPRTYDQDVPFELVFCSLGGTNPST